MDNFKEAADRCVDRGDRATARRILVERKIVQKMISLVLADGHSISVNDGEEWVVKRSSSKKEILHAMFSTDEDVLTVYDDKGMRAAWFSFVYGNDGYDVLSDYSANAYGDKIWNALKPSIEKMELAV